MGSSPEELPFEPSRHGLAGTGDRRDMLGGLGAAGLSLLTALGVRSVHAEGSSGGKRKKHGNGAKPTGRTGPTGPPPSATVIVRTASVTGANEQTASVNCNAGEVATGGGLDVSGTSNFDEIRSFPLTGGSPTTSGNPANGWRATADVGGASRTLTVYVVCVSM